MSGRRWWWWPVAFVSLMLLQGAWSLATPPVASPDEPAHVYRAVSLWEGQLLPERPTSAGWEVQVPQSVKAYGYSSDCFRRHPERSAACSPDRLSTASTPTKVRTGAGRYLPVYYAFVGWPSRFDATVRGLYAMRLLSALVTAALLATAVTIALRWRGPRWPALGIALAITPMVLSFGGVVNPSSWEMAGGVLLWTALLALLSGQSSQSPRVLLLLAGLGATAELVTRRISPGWVVLVAAVLLLASGAAQRRFVLRRRMTWVVAAVLAALAAFSVWWHLTFDLASLGNTVDKHKGLTRFGTVVAAADRLPYWMHQQYGIFGWLDTWSPAVCFAIWWGLVFTLFAAALFASRGRLRVALLVTALLPPVLSVLVESSTWNRFGPSWQARYVMPFSLGLTLLSAAVLARAGRWQPSLVRSVARWAVLTLAAVNSFTFIAALHRWTSGINGEWLGSLAWQPPGRAVPVVLLYLAGTAVLSWLLLRPALPEQADAAAAEATTEPETAESETAEPAPRETAVPLTWREQGPLRAL